MCSQNIAGLVRYARLVMPHRQTPRVILRRPRRGRFDEGEILVTEIGLGGAKFEHSARLDVRCRGTLSCGPLNTSAIVRHSELLPAKTGIVYQSGIEFVDLDPSDRNLLFDLLVQEAKEQVVEWEANLAGDAPMGSRHAVVRSAVAVRFLSLKFSPNGWIRSITSDPNQPIDGVAVLEDTPESEIEMLRQTYASADDAGRELMRRIATVAILERLRGQ
jgi:hypothetical protein